MNSVDSEKLEALAAQVPLFSGLSEKEYGAICNLMVFRKFQKGDVILHQDDQESQTFFVIISGRVYVAIITPEGKQTILATLQKGEFFGEMAILDGEPRSASVVAAEYCELFMLYRKSFLEMLRSFPTIAIQMLITMSHRIRQTNKQINTLSLMSVYGRVAEVILRYAKEHGKRYGDIIMINQPPTQQMIAEMAGTSRETVSRVLSLLRKKQYITTNRKRLVILNEEKLYY